MKQLLQSKIQSKKPQFPEVFLEIGLSRNGKGIFTNRKVRAGEKIFKVEGRLVTVKEAELRGGTFNANTFRFSKRLYLSPLNRLGDYLNHSCRPNCYVRKSNGALSVFALLEISSGEEILMDYSTIISIDDDWTMLCNCGEKYCRKTIGRCADLPLGTKRKYIALGIVPKYIEHEGRD